MNHPPIPPNSKHFVWADASDIDADVGESPDDKFAMFRTCCETIVLYGEYTETMIQDCEDEARQIIAAVARCAWLDIAYVEERTALNCPKPSERCENLNQQQRASVANAEAWRVWGEQCGK